MMHGGPPPSYAPVRPLSDGSVGAPSGIMPQGPALAPGQPMPAPGDQPGGGMKAPPLAKRIAPAARGAQPGAKA
jgi:hypothetical protein